MLVRYRPFPRYQTLGIVFHNVLIVLRVVINFITLFFMFYLRIKNKGYRFAL